MSDYPDVESNVPDDTYDPARRRRKGRMPAALARYWAGRRRAKMDPARRHRRHRRHSVPLYHPRRHRRRARYDPRRRSRSFGRIFRRRSYDPSIRGFSPMWSAIGTPAATMLGSVLHNWLSVKKNVLAGAINLPMAGKITTLGLAGAVGSTLLGYFGRGPWTDFLAHVTAGMAAEGFNVPTVENVARPEGGPMTGLPGGNAAPGAVSAMATPYVPAEASWYR